MKCLLCESENVQVRERIPRDLLLKLWADTQVDVSRELRTPEVIAYQCPDCGLSFFDPQHAGGNAFYSALGNFDWYYLHPGKTEYDYVQRFIRTGDRILDIGSGRGVLFTRIDKPVEYTGLELSSKAVALAREAGINVLQEDLLVHAREHAGQYDLVCLFQVLEHLTELDAFLRAIQACLKPGGLFCIAVPNNDAFIAYTANYTFNLPPHHTILWTERSLRFLARRYAFEIVDVHREPLQDVHREIARHAALTARLKKWTGHPVRLGDDTARHRRLSSIASRLLANGLFRRTSLGWLDKQLTEGQSIMITLQKI